VAFFVVATTECFFKLKSYLISIRIRLRST